MRPGTPEGVMERCPQCGGRFLRVCGRDQWGWYHTELAHGNHMKKTLLCSGPCAKAYSAEREAAAIRRVKGLPSFRAWEMYQRGMSLSEIAKETGCTAASVNSKINYVETKYWHELELIREGA